jgi:hypothetical protein
MKKAAFNNLTNILYYLDRHEAVITLCNKYKESKVLDKSAKRMLDRAERQIALMAFHKAKSCHIETLIEIEEGDIESEEDAAADDEGK